jgi:hypothetical protein
LGDFGEFCPVTYIDDGWLVKGLPENEINIGQKNVIKQYLSKFRKFAQDNTADDADLKNLKTAVGRFYKELGL